jgi:hypothetical protein
MSNTSISGPPFSLRNTSEITKVAADTEKSDTHHSGAEQGSQGFQAGVSGRHLFRGSGPDRRQRRRSLQISLDENAELLTGPTRLDISDH